MIHDSAFIYQNTEIDEISNNVAMVSDDNPAVRKIISNPVDCAMMSGSSSLRSVLVVNQNNFGANEIFLLFTRRVCTQMINQTKEKCDG